SSPRSRSPGRKVLASNVAAATQVGATQVGARQVGAAQVGVTKVGATSTEAGSFRGTAPGRLAALQGGAITDTSIAPAIQTRRTCTPTATGLVTMGTAAIP